MSQRVGRDWSDLAHTHAQGYVEWGTPRFWGTPRTHRKKIKFLEKTLKDEEFDLEMKVLDSFLQLLLQMTPTTFFWNARFSLCWLEGTQVQGMWNVQSWLCVFTIKTQWNFMLLWVCLEMMNLLLVFIEFLKISPTRLVFLFSTLKSSREAIPLSSNSNNGTIFNIMKFNNMCERIWQIQRYKVIIIVIIH